MARGEAAALPVALTEQIRWWGQLGRKSCILFPSRAGRQCEVSRSHWKPQVCEGASYLWVQRVEESSKKRRLAPGGRPHDTATLLPRSLGGPCSHYPVLHHPAPTTLLHPVNPSKLHHPIGRINQLVVQVRLPSLTAGSVFPILGQMCRASRPTWHLHPFLPISVPGVAR